jgi:hypothetical protein
LKCPALPHREWKAYPQFDPPEAFPAFKMVEGLCLNNAWENGASAMEMSAVAGKNCALLVTKHIRSQMGHIRRDEGPIVSDEQAEL